ncbi:MAG: GGDEF domain-containing protein, partial [Deltaproteobacteria bacterium]
MMPSMRLPRRLPSSFVYPLAGLCCAPVAPGGLLLLRAIVGRGPSEVGSWVSQLHADWATYAYLTVSTAWLLVALGLYLGKKQDTSQSLAVTDALTGLRNRRYFRGRLLEELDRARRHRTPMSLLLVDLDWLKVINERLGHQAGDRALRA